MFGKSDEHDFSQINTDDPINHFIPLWAKVVYLILYSILFFLVFFVTIKHYIQLMKNELRCIIWKPNMQLTTYCCFLATIIVRVIEYLLLLVSPINYLTLNLLYLAPLASMFTGICIFIVFWLEVYHTPSGVSQPLNSIKRFQYIFIGVNSTQVVLIAVLCLFFAVDIKYWNGRNTPLLFQIFPAVGGGYWIIVSSVFAWYYIKSKKRLQENMDAVGQQTIAIMSRIASALGLLALSLFLGGMTYVLVSQLGVNPHAGPILNTMSLLFMEILPTLAILYIYSVPLHFMELFKEPQSKPWFEL